MVDKIRVGRAGQLAVMSELLLQGYNVAIPEIDVGEDVWVVQDSEEHVWRIQVKTATGKRKRYGYSGGFAIPLRQLRTPTGPPLIYVLALRTGLGRWEFVIISRRQVRAEQRAHGVGTVQEGNLRLYLAFKEQAVVCAGRDWQRYRNRFDLVGYA